MSPNDVVVLIGQIASFLIEVVKPMAIAAPLVAILIDLLKRAKWWQDGYAGWASLVLNLVFSAMLFAAAKLGYQGEYEQAIKISISALPIVLRVVGGLGVTYFLHNFFKTVGIGYSVSEQGKIGG